MNSQLFIIQISDSNNKNQSSFENFFYFQINTAQRQNKNSKTNLLKISHLKYRS